MFVLSSSLRNVRTSLRVPGWFSELTIVCFCSSAVRLRFYEMCYNVPLIRKVRKTYRPGFLSKIRGPQLTVIQRDVSYSPSDVRIALRSVY